MSNLRSRIEKLEGKSTGSITAVIYVPDQWPEEQREQAVKHLVSQQNLSEPFGTWVLPDGDVTEAKIGFIGDLGDLFASIAARGTRVMDHPV